MDSLAQKLQHFMTLFNSGTPPDSDSIRNLKIAMTQLGVKPPQYFKDVPAAGLENDEELKKVFLARECLEYLARYSLHVGDENSFERYMVQLKTYYFDYGPFLKWSAHREPLLGVYFLYLLADNRIAEFHTELELIQDLNNQYMKYAVDLEQSKMEGSYSSLLRKGETCPQGYYYERFAQKLVTTARHDIADSLEKAYDSLSSKEAMGLLLLNDAQKFQEFVVERGWKESNGVLVFNSEVKESQGTDAVRLITQNLSYAMEIERII